MILLLVLMAYAVALSVHLARGGLRSSAGTAGAAPPPRPHRLLVVGASGGTGRELVVEALVRGYEVTALVRDPARLNVEHHDLSVVVGDVLDPQSLAAAMSGQEAVVCALGHKKFYRPTRILSDGTGNILQAMQAAGVRRLVCETSLGLGDSAWRMGLYYTLFTLPFILPFYFSDKVRQERLIAGSGVEWVVVRPGALNSGPGRGRVRHGNGVGGLIRTPQIARADVAAFMLDQLESDDYLGCAPGVVW